MTAKSKAKAKGKELATRFLLLTLDPYHFALCLARYVFSINRQY